MGKRFLRNIPVLAILWASAAWAATMYPQIRVDFQHPVNVGPETLAPGHYTFRQIESTSNIPIFRVEKPDGTNVTVTAIGMSARAPASPSSTFPPTAQDSDIVLQKINGTYYLDKIWIAGRSRGWAFDIPESVRSQAHEMQQETMKGSYQESSSSQ